MTIQADFRVVSNKNYRVSLHLYRQFRHIFEYTKYTCQIHLGISVTAKATELFRLHLPRDIEARQGPRGTSGHFLGVQPTHFRSKKQPASALVPQLLYLLKQQQLCCLQHVVVKFFGTSVRNWMKKRHLKLCVDSVQRIAQ